jgi:hypothetical protein
MGLFGDLIQHSQIKDQSRRSESLEARVDSLEQELHATQQLLQTVLQRLETYFGEDIDRDGQVGQG